MRNGKYLWCDIDSTLTLEDLMPRLGPLGKWSWIISAKLGLREKAVARAQPDMLALKYLDILKDAGFRIDLVTAREECLRAATAVWLKKWNVAYDCLYLTDNGVWNSAEWVANWKADIIEDKICCKDLGPEDTLVFIDDNPVTCEIVDRRLGQDGLITINTNVWTYMNGLIRHLIG